MLSAENLYLFRNSSCVKSVNCVSIRQNLRSCLCITECMSVILDLLTVLESLIPKDQKKYNNLEMKSGRLFTAATQHSTPALANMLSPNHHSVLLVIKKTVNYIYQPSSHIINKPDNIHEKQYILFQTLQYS